MSQPDAHPLLHRADQDPGKENIQCRRTLDFTDGYKVVEYRLIPGIHQHIPQITDRDAIFREIDRVLITLGIGSIYHLNYRYLFMPILHFYSARTHSSIYNAARFDYARLALAPLSAEGYLCQQSRFHLLSFTRVVEPVFPQERDDLCADDSTVPILIESGEVVSARREV